MQKLPAQLMVASLHGFANLLSSIKAPFYHSLLGVSWVQCLVLMELFPVVTRLYENGLLFGVSIMITMYILSGEESSCVPFKIAPS